MKSTGIIRRIDELGRVSIPKEIRRTARVRDGDPLEIFLDDSGNITLKKYSAIGSLEEFAPTYAESIRKTIGHNVIITDRDNVITYNGYSQRDLKGNRLSQEVEKVIEERQYRMFHMNEQIRLILNDQPKSLSSTCKHGRGSGA
jgi:AbrB family transcriptional regulator (stage V sporulation protein T)